MSGIPRHTPINSDRQRRSHFLQGITFGTQIYPRATLLRKKPDSLSATTVPLESNYRKEGL